VHQLITEYNHFNSCIKVCQRETTYFNSLLEKPKDLHSDVCTSLSALLSTPMYHSNEDYGICSDQGSVSSNCGHNAIRLVSCNQFPFPFSVGLLERGDDVSLRYSQTFHSNLSIRISTRSRFTKIVEERFHIFKSQERWIW
jgi:hypothetical protein